MRTPQGALGAAQLSHGRAAGGGSRDAGRARRRGRLPQNNRDRLDRILEEIATGDLYDLQERYVLLFDRTRSLSLHLFEHVHGESRDRGQAMVDLKALYERHGLFMARASCPTICRCSWSFSPQIPEAEACGLLGETAHILEAIRQRLKKRKCPLFVGVLLRPGAGGRQAADRRSSRPC